MTREFKVGDRVVAARGHMAGQYGVIESAGVMYDWRVKFGPLKYYYMRDGELTHAEPVPVGYTGKLRDMDLLEGDVVENKASGIHYTMRKDKHGVLRCCVISVDESIQDYTLISRATQAATHAWSDWQLSRKDGYMAQQYAEVQTVPLDGTDQVVYRGRGEAPEKASHLITVGHKQYYVTTIDGEPDWSTAEEFVL